MYNFVTLKQLRPRLPSIINDVDEHLGRYIIAKHGQAIAVLLSIVDFESLREVKNISGKVLIALAVWFGKTRLIDNIVVDNIVVNADTLTRR